MKWYRPALFGLLILLPVSPGEAKKKEKPDPVNRIFLIGESPEWIDSSLDVRPQDHLTVRAGAEVCFSASNPESCVRAGGWARESYATEWPESAAECNDPFPELNHAAVVARVGEEVFEVGRSTLVEGKEGRLELTINDCSFEGEHRNEGNFSVIIVVENPAAWAVRGGTDLIDEAIEAMGGKAINQVGSLAVKADCTGPTGPFTTEVFTIRPDRTLFRQSADGATMELLAVRDEAWQIDRELGKREKLSKKNLAMIRGHEFQLVLFELDERFQNHTVPVVEEGEGASEETTAEAENEDSCVLVLMEDLEGLPASVCLDPDTKLPVRLIHQPPGAKKQLPIVIELERWLEVNDVQFLAGFTLRQGEDAFTYAYTEILPNSVGRSVFKEISRSALEETRRELKAAKRGESPDEPPELPDEEVPTPEEGEEDGQPGHFRRPTAG